MMSPDLLRQATGCTAEHAALYAGPLSDACEHYHINTPARLAAFLAQLSHESGALRYVSEVWGPTAAQKTYEGRRALGNTQPGDGERFRGHGLLQVTGRANHAAARDRLRRDFGDAVPDFEADPEALMRPRWACLSAADYWQANHCNELADKGDFEAITRRINGGLNGYADRVARWEKAKAAMPQSQPDITMPPGEAPDWAPTPPKENAMALPAFIIPAALELIKLIPQAGALFGSGSAVSERNIKGAEILVDTVTKAVGAANAQDAVEKIKADPNALRTAAKAVEDRWYEIQEAGGGGIDGARKANAVYIQPGAAGFWLNPSFWISIILIAMPMMLLVDVLFVHPESYVGELRTQIVTGVLMVIGMVGGYWIGTSISSAKKDERSAG